jgi:hypothetical protein
MRRFFYLAALLAACSGGDKGGEGTDTGTGGEGGDGGGTDGTDGTDGTGDPTIPLSDYINTTKAPVGDFTGFAAGKDGNGGWLTQTQRSDAAGATFTLNGTVQDFQDEFVVPDATVEVWYADEVSAVPDVTEVSDGSGLISASMPKCQPITYKTSTDASLGDTVNTFEAHQVYGFGDSQSDTLNSVSTTTYTLIPSLLGVSVDPERGTAAGTAYDVNDDPIEGAQVVVRSLVDDTIPAGVTVKYFVNSFPNREQPETSPDGLWVAINIPAGDWKVEMYVSDGAGGHFLMGQTVLKVYGDSINIANIYTGYDSVKLPSDCLAP